MKLTSGSAAIATKVPCIEISDAFHTLEVHLSPPGSKQKQMSIVRKHSDIYHINVSPLNLTPDEAYSSYMQYLHPKLIYPLPCSSLTQQ